MKEALRAEQPQRETAAASAAVAIEQERSANQLAVSDLRSEITEQAKAMRHLRLTLKVVAATLLGAVTVAAVVALIALDLVDGLLATALVVTAGALILTAAAAIAAGWNRAWVAFGILGAVVGFTAAVYEILK